MSCSYNNCMYTTIPPELDEDNSLCDNCIYAHGICWKAGFCILDELN